MVTWWFGFLSPLWKRLLLKIPKWRPPQTYMFRGFDLNDAPIGISESLRPEGTSPKKSIFPITTPCNFWRLLGVLNSYLNSSQEKKYVQTHSSHFHTNMFFLHIFPTQHFLIHTVDGRNPKTTTRDVCIKPVVNNGISATNLNWISSINHPVFGLPAKSNFWPLALVCQALAAIGTDCWEGDAS